MPPNCRPECSVSAECSQDKACSNYKCIDPCPGTCGTNARCQVLNHNPICSCTPGYTGDPFARCFLEPSKLKNKAIKKILMNENILEPSDEPIGDPCLPSPCGPYSSCRANGNIPSCSCLPNYIGRSPNCRPECTINAECPSNLACLNEKCSDPCIGSCGLNTLCTVVTHNPVCKCKPGFNGDPFSICNEVQPSKIIFFLNCI